MTQRKPYPSDVSREQFEVIRPQLEGFRRDTRPRTYDLYDIFCGILYVKNTGCQWSALPHDYPPYHTVYTSFREWGAKPFSAAILNLKRLYLSMRYKISFIFIFGQ